MSDVQVRAGDVWEFQAARGEKYRAKGLSDGEVQFLDNQVIAAFGPRNPSGDGSKWVLIYRAPAPQGPPAGYVECPKKCGRWFKDSDAMSMKVCNHCHDLRMRGSLKMNEQNWGPDWTPTLAAAPEAVKPKYPERRAGQVWQLEQPDGTSKRYTLSHRYEDHRWACVGYGECGLEDACWDGRYEMTLISEAPAESAKPAPVVAAPKFVVDLGHEENRCWNCEKPGLTVVLRISRRHMETCEHYECDSCYLFYESCLTGPGNPYTGPERLPRPKMAHVAGSHDDDLLGVK